MENTSAENFTEKFEILTPANQQYITAILQALIFAQLHASNDENKTALKH